MRCLHLQKLTRHLQSPAAGSVCRPLSARQPGTHYARDFSGSAGGAAAHGALRRLVLPLAAGLLTGAGCATAATFALMPSLRAPEAPALAAAGVAEAGPAWVRELASRSDIMEVLNAETLRTHQHPLLSEDHMFSALLRNDMVQNLTCFYDPASRRFFSVLQLGTDVCGYRRIVHGGLTAAICDESFGGLLMAIRKQRLLPFWGPAFTAQLDITYLSKIMSASTVLCTTEVESIEGRKVWMRAVVSDGPGGKVYCTARALFVAPKSHRLLQEGLKLLFPWPFGSKT